MQQYPVAPVLYFLVGPSARSQREFLPLQCEFCARKQASNLLAIFHFSAHWPLNSAGKGDEQSSRKNTSLRTGGAKSITWPAGDAAPSRAHSLNHARPATTKDDEWRRPLSLPVATSPVGRRRVAQWRATVSAGAFVRAECVCVRSPT